MKKQKLNRNLKVLAIILIVILIAFTVFLSFKTTKTIINGSKTNLNMQQRINLRRKAAELKSQDQYIELINNEEKSSTTYKNIKSSEMPITSEQRKTLKDLGILFAINENGKVYVEDDLSMRISEFIEGTRNVINDSRFQAVVFSLFVFILILIIIKLILKLIQLIAKWRIYTKAGKPGWAILLPVYKDVIMFEVADISPALLVLGFLIFIPFIGPIIVGTAFFVLKIVVAVKVSKVFGKSGGFAVGIIFLPTIFYSILGFGKAKYMEEKEKTKEEEKGSPEEVKEIKAQTKTIESKVIKEEKKEEKPKTTAKKTETTTVKKEEVKAKKPEGKTTKKPTTKIAEPKTKKDTK